MSEKIAKTTESGLVYYDEPDPPKPPPEPEPLTESQLVEGYKLLVAFVTDLPVDAQVEVFALMKRAFMHRGGSSLLPRGTRDKTYIERMADVFAANGHSQPEYT